jgi:hypothetical protein
MPKESRLNADSVVYSFKDIRYNQRAFLIIGMVVGVIIGFLGGYILGGGYLN